MDLLKYAGIKMDLKPSAPENRKDQRCTHLHVQAEKHHDRGCKHTQVWCVRIRGWVSGCGSNIHQSQRGVKFRPCGVTNGRKIKPIWREKSPVVIIISYNKPYTKGRVGRNKDQKTES